VITRDPFPTSAEEAGGDAILPHHLRLGLPGFGIHVQFSLVLTVNLFIDHSRAVVIHLTLGQGADIKSQQAEEEEKVPPIIVRGVEEESRSGNLM